MRHARSLVPLCAILLGCPVGGLPPTGAVRGAIVGGTPDAGHPAVGAVLLGSGSSGGLCTGTLISPKVAVTAAHCVQGEGGAYPANFVLGAGMNSGTRYTITAYEAHPNYTPDALGVGIATHDIAVVVLSKAASATPMAYRKTTINGLTNAGIVFSGFGIRSGYDQSLVGDKYKVSTTIGSVEAQGFWNYTTSNNPKNTCSGDSGGPGFYVEGGVEQIVGVVSSGDDYCVKDGWNTRVDVNASFLAQMIAKYDGGSVTTPVCGNGTCDTGETTANCPKDCPAATCGDGNCDAGETAASCPADCGGASGGIWGACDSNYGCPGVEVCLQEDDGSLHCTLECTVVGDCPSGYECAGLQGGGGACAPTGGTTACGNGTCEAGETTATCPGDCPPPAPVCGNGTCESGETTASCPGDCPPPAPVCGNGTCESGETTASCPGDCPAPAPVCGDGVCEDGETTATCPGDCPAPAPVCGNGTCDDGETRDSCPADCPPPVQPDCGNGVCELGESPVSCPKDCRVGGPVCGDGSCDDGEACDSCPQDCGSCGDGADVIDSPDGGTVVMHKASHGCSGTGTPADTRGAGLVLLLGVMAFGARRRVGA